jgi:hypothetical protein
MSDEADHTPNRPLDKVESHWGEQDAAHFGYASDEERKARRGLEDWELVEKIPESQRKVPYWFFAVVLVVLLVGVGLAFPFWGNRPGYERAWVDWGFVAALFYIAAAGTFVYFMVQFYGSPTAGRLDSDHTADTNDDDRQKSD